LSAIALGAPYSMAHVIADPDRLRHFNLVVPEDPT
jgi:hypothetical protein